METIPRALTYLEIDAWASVTGRKPSIFELSVFARIEQVFWRVYHGGGKDEQPKSLVKQFAFLQENKKVRKVSVGK